MEFNQTASFCGLDATVRVENSDIESTIKHSRCNQPLESIYPLDIQFYTRIPCLLSYEKMKEVVKERILALKEIHLIMKNSGLVAFNDKRKNVTIKLGLMRLHRYAKFINSTGHRTHSIQELEDRVIDHASFVALRLAVAPDSEDRKLHRMIEEELFHLRVSALDDEGIRELLAFNKIEYEKINYDERVELKDDLVELLHNPDNYDNTEFFKVPILKLLGFIKVYDVHIKDGIAFLPLEHMRAVLRVHYHEYLKYEDAAVDISKLQIACKFVDGSDKFNEFFDFCCAEFDTMHQKIMKESGIFLHMINELAVTAFPPCMRVLHENLRERHHLKHESRLQYTLFLKGIGLNVDDSIRLFCKEFTQVVPFERFEKEYAYYIYHAYGLKGRKLDTPPKDCSLIINNVASFGDCNGCVFVTNGVADIEDLGRKLARWNISEEHINDIIQYTKQGQCGHACANYFQAINRYPFSGPVLHPNKFFNESRRISNLPKGCISDESGDSNDEDEKAIPQKTLEMEIDNESISTVICNEMLIELTKMVIEWEEQISPDSFRSGAMVKLKRKL